MTLRAVILKAVSSQVQASEDKLSLQEQEDWARAWCAAHQATIVAILTIDGHPRSEPDIFKLFQDYEAIGCPAYSQHYELCRKRAFDVLLAWSDDRLGRAPTIISHVIDMTVSVAGATVELKFGGTINRQNKNMRMAMSVASVPTQLDQLKERRNFGMTKRAQDGKFTGNKPIFTHTQDRDEFGQPIGEMKVRKEMRRFLKNLAELFLEGVAYNKLGKLLYERYGHVNKKGKPYGAYILYDTLLNPHFWGNSARFFADPKYAQGWDLWIFDETFPPPPGVLIFYGTHEPAYKGDLARRVKDEIRRRRSAIRGSALPEHTHRFTGLLCCDECQRSLMYGAQTPPSKPYPRYRCMTNWYAGRPMHCSQHKAITEEKVQAFIDSLLRTLENSPEALDVLLSTPQHERAAVSTSSLQSEIAALENQISRLIHDQSTAPENVRNLYAEQITHASERLDILMAHLSSLQRESAKRQQQRESARTLQTVLENLDAFWKRQDREVNQALHAILGDFKFMVRNGAIVGLKRLPR